MSRYELVVFDNDGVLVDSEPHANAVLAELLTECGLAMSYEECVREFMGGTLGLVREVVEPRLGRALPDDFEDSYHERLFDRLRSSLTPVPGVVAALDAIALPVCVASSGSRERIRMTLSAVGLINRFDGRLFSADEVARGKPHPGLFLYVADSLGVDPGRCVVVEDSPLGVRAARAAGMAVIGYAGLTPADRLSEADVVISDMKELPDLLRRPGIHH